MSLSKKNDIQTNQFWGEFEYGQRLRRDNQRLAFVLLHPFGEFLFRRHIAFPSKIILIS